MSDLDYLVKESFNDQTWSRPDWTKDSSRDPSLLWLNKNENIDPILQSKIAELVTKVPLWAMNTYPETAKVYVKLATLTSLKSGNFLLTNGSDGAIRSIFEVFIQPGDKVVHTEPTFAMYDIYSKMYGATQLKIPYSASDNGPKLNFAFFLATIREQKPKLVCLPNPDSPSGTVISDSQMESLIVLTQEVGVILLIDEAYFPFYPKTYIRYVQDYPHMFIARSFSKAWGAAGFRVGYLAGHSDIMKVLHKSRSMYEVSTFSSELIYLLLDIETEVRESVSRLEEGRKFFIQEMTKLGFSTTTSFGNFLHVNFKEKDAKISDALRGTVLYRREFGGAPSLSGFSRFSIGTKEQMEKIVEKIRGIL